MGLGVDSAELLRHLVASWRESGPSSAMMLIAEEDRRTLDGLVLMLVGRESTR